MALEQWPHGAGGRPLVSGARVVSRGYHTIAMRFSLFHMARLGTNDHLGEHNAPFSYPMLWTWEVKEFHKF